MNQEDRLWKINNIKERLPSLEKLIEGDLGELTARSVISDFNFLIVQLERIEIVCDNMECYDQVPYDYGLSESRAYDLGVTKVIEQIRNA